MPMRASPTFLLLCAATFVLSGYSQTRAAPAPAPAPALEPLAISANVSGSLGNLCSSQAGVLALIQGSATNQDEAGLAVSVPSNLANAAAVQQIAQVRIICGPFQAGQAIPISTTQLLCKHSPEASRPAPACLRLDDVKYS